MFGFAGDLPGDFGEAGEFFELGLANLGTYAFSGDVGEKTRLSGRSICLNSGLLRDRGCFGTDFFVGEMCTPLCDILILAFVVLTVLYLFKMWAFCAAY